jgi:hypothetical protein
MSTSQKGTRASWTGVSSVVTLAGALALAACGGDDPIMMGPATGTAGTVGATAGTAAPTGAAGTGAAGMMTSALAGSSGTSGGAACSKPTGASGTGATAAAGTGATATAGTGAATAGTGVAGTGGGDVTSMAGTGGASGAAGTAGTDGAAGSPGGTGVNSCLDGDTDYFKQGKFQFMQMTMGRIKFWKPMVPAGCKVPIVHLANGTGATCSAYNASLERLASHGFLACCYEDTNTGAGTQGLEAFKTALAMFPDLADKKFGSTGHSQGGQSSFVVQSLAEKEFGVGPDTKFAGLAMEPASNFGTQPAGGWQAAYKAIKSPMFMFSGRGTDGLVSQGWVQDAFNTLDKSIEAYHWTKTGATHIPVPNGEEQQISIAWFRWKLLDDQAACKAFKAIPMMDTAWEEVASMNKAECK